MRGRFLLALRDALDAGPLPLLAGSLVVLYVGQDFARSTSMGAGDHGSADFALWWVWFASGLFALVLGSRTLGAPLADGSARFLLVGPLSPARWATERLLATALLCAALTGGLCAALVPLGLDGVGSFTLFLLAESLLLVSFGGFAGVLLRPLPALGLAAALWWIGHLAGPWAGVMADLGHPWAERLLPFLPDLDTLDAHRAVLADTPIPASRVLRGLAWAGAWTGAFGAATVSLLSTRDL